jgi:hypothetical protein
VKLRGLLVAGLLGLGAAVAPAGAAETVTVAFREARLDDALQTVGRLAGIEVHLYASLDRPVSADWHEMPAAEALRRLLRGENAVLVYGAGSPGRIVAVHVYPAPARVARGAIATGPGVRGSSSARAMAAAGPSASGTSGGTTPAMRAPDRAAVERQARVRALHEDAGDVPVTDTLARALGENPDPTTRLAAAEGLGKTWEESAVLPLASALAGDADTFVRAGAAQALGETWSPTAVEPLAQALLADPGRSVREEAAAGLGQIGDASAVSSLIQALGDPDVWVRLAAANALGAIASPAAASALIAVSSADEDEWVRDAAGEAVAEILGSR